MYTFFFFDSIGHSSGQKGKHFCIDNYSNTAAEFLKNPWALQGRKMVCFASVAESDSIIHAI